MTAKEEGFTLVEIMVTFVILGILLALAVPNYITRKRMVEYNGATAIARSIAAAEKNYYLTSGFYASTANTTDTNTVLEGVTITDGSFRNYRASAGGGTFTVLVDNGGCIYTFNAEGVRTATNGASDCLP